MSLDFLKGKGIDTDAGLGYLGDEEMYNEILKDFKDNFVTQMNDIKAKFEAKDWTNYSILVHALKSNARTLGINDLADMAYEHEKASKTPEVLDVNYLNAHVGELFAKANQVYAIVDEYFKG